MLEKFVAIEGVGSFDSFKAPGRTTFTKLSLVFGENGAGKTTLVSILRSWKDGSAALLEERRTLGVTTPQKVQLLESAALCSFSGGKWQRPCPPLEIFDETYVEENVYGEAGINVGNRRSLYQVVLGKTGNELRIRLVDIDRKSRAIAKIVTECERELGHVHGQMPLETFLRLEQTKDIDDEIEKTEARLRAVSQAEQIRTHSLPEVPEAQPFDIDALRAFLSSSISTVAANAAELVRDHAEHRLDGKDSSQWLATGVGFGIEDDCPFCRLSTSGNPLIDAYKDYFSQAYAEFETATREQAKGILDSVDLAKMQQMVGNTKLALANIEWWKQHLECEALELDTIALLSAARDAHRIVHDLVEAKLRAVLSVIDIEASDLASLQQFNKQMDELAEFAKRVNVLRRRIQIFQLEIERSDATNASEQLLRLRATKQRHEQQCDNLCKRLQSARRIKNRLSDRKARARDSLQEYSADLLGRYQQGINAYLQRFGASYRVGPVAEDHAGGQPSCKFSIELRGKTVRTETADKPGEVRFKTLLSSGDKRTLALALFLASLDTGKALADTIVLLDDPMTSLDQARELQTIKQCEHLAQRCRQVLVFSHDPLFLREVWDSSRTETPTALKVHLRGASSGIEPWDIVSDTAPKFYTQLYAIKQFIETGNGDLIAIRRMLRPLLETWLRHRRPTHFGPKEWLGGMIDAIRSAGPGSSLAKLLPYLSDLSDINDYTKDEHHGSNPGDSASTINASQLATYAKLTLDLVTES